MTSIQFAYKELVAPHHLTIPPLGLKIDKKRSFSKQDAKFTPSLEDNLIIQGDNLHALKALLPKYGGRVNCIYIDPPYNTGNEGWAFNDNMTDPAFKQWLKKTIDSEDLERHDKWCCMMWPRLQLLRELLADNGVIFVSIDDNEQHRLRMMMDEIFGAENFVTNIVWQKKFSPQNDARWFSDNHDFIICYAINKDDWKPILLPRTDAQNERYKNIDDDPRGPWGSSGLDVKTYEEEYDYPITTPSGRVVNPPKDSCWRYSPERFKELVADNRIWFGKKGNNVPRVKKFLSEVKSGVTPLTIWKYEDVGHTQYATQTLKRLGISFSNPKPHTLIEKALRIGADKNAIILDSFAGSGTTAHATLALNKKDGGNRKFILVESNDHANTKTAERVRRVIRGIPKDRDIDLREGTGGSFTYCTLDEPIDTDNMLAGESLPDVGSLASFLLYNAHGISTEKTLKPRQDGLFYSTDTTDYYLLYKPDIKYLRTASLTEKTAAAISKKGKEAIVFAPDRVQSQRELSALGITFCRLPDAILSSTGGCP